MSTWCKFDPITKKIDLKTGYTSEQENSVCIDGFNSANLKDSLQESQVEDRESPVFDGAIIDLPQGYNIETENGLFYSLDAQNSRCEIPITALQLPASEGDFVTSSDVVGGTPTDFTLAKLIVVESVIKLQKITAWGLKSVWVLEEDSTVALTKAKAARKEAIANESFSKRESTLPTYKLINCAVGVYDAEVVTSYKTIVNSYRDACYAAYALIDACETVEAVNAINAVWP